MSIRRVKVNGRKVWQARVALCGQRRSSIHGSKDDARQAEGALLGALKAEAARAAEAGQRPATLKALLECYVADLEARGKGSERAASTALAIERMLPALLAKPVSAITNADVFAFRALRAREGKTIMEAVGKERRARRVPAKPSTINRDLRTLRAALKQARPEYRFPGGAFFPEDETRVRWLRPEEEILVLDPMPSPFREIAKLAALTLMRLSEIRLLRREMVRLEQGVVVLPRAKGGARAVMLSQDARKLLQCQLEAHDAAWVFPGPEGVPYSRVHVSRVFRKAARGAGLTDFHFHDLRHHGATMALNANFSAPIVQQLGGWKTERMMRRYAAVTDKTLRAAAEAVSGNGGWQQVANPASAQATGSPSQG